MSRFLYGVKLCSKCLRRNICNLKNDPKTLVKKSIVAEVTSRPPFKVKIYSFCRYFSPERENTKMMVSPEKARKQLNINVENMLEVLTTKSRGKEMQKLVIASRKSRIARLDSPLNTIPPTEVIKRIMVSEET